MAPASEVTPANPGSRKVRDIEGGGSVGVCEGKELSPGLVGSTISHNRESAFVVSGNLWSNWNLAAENLCLRMLGCGFSAVQGEICVWPGVTASGACPRKRAFSVSLASATGKFCPEEDNFQFFFFLVLSMPVLHPCRECLESPCGSTGDTALCWVADAV